MCRGIHSTAARAWHLSVLTVQPTVIVSRLQVWFTGLPYTVFLCSGVHHHTRCHVEGLWCPSVVICCIFISGTWLNACWGRYDFRRPLPSSCPCAFPFVCLHQRGSHWTDFLESWYRVLTWKSAEQIHIWLKSGKNSGHFTCRLA